MIPRALAQPSILADVPALGRFLTFDLRVGADPRRALVRWSETISGELTVVGLGLPLVSALSRRIEGLRAFPALAGHGCVFPSTQGALWCFVGGDDTGELFDQARDVRALLEPTFTLAEDVAAFKYHGGRDLTGYEDGTENPKDDAAVSAAIVAGRGAGLDGSSFVAVQRWTHDLEGFARRSPAERDAIIGRERTSNEEMSDAPPSAHVKRAARESFDPPAFMLRRSMPWGTATLGGLYFVAYGESLDRFERVLSRMSGRDDGVVDGLLGISKPESGGYYWCPPVRASKVDWSALEL
jgi:putative iron-dependent peroxidase